MTPEQISNAAKKLRERCPIQFIWEAGHILWADLTCAPVSQLSQEQFYKIIARNCNRALAGKSNE